MPDNPSQKRYPPELRERGVRMVLELIEQQGGERHGVVTRVARQLVGWRVTTTPRAGPGPRRLGDGHLVPDQ